uniref:Uncharacterized protein n=1 Tax=Anguilla anguilla TaxID=7936 RepID=A0A0E9WYB7_ANGAN
MDTCRKKLKMINRRHQKKACTKGYMELFSTKSATCSYLTRFSNLSVCLCFNFIHFFASKYHQKHTDPLKQNEEQHVVFC